MTIKTYFSQIKTTFTNKNYLFVVLSISLTSSFLLNTYFCWYKKYWLKDLYFLSTQSFLVFFVFIYLFVLKARQFFFLIFFNEKVIVFFNTLEKKFGLTTIYQIGVFSFGYICIERSGMNLEYCLELPEVFNVMLLFSLYRVLIFIPALSFTRNFKNELLLNTLKESSQPNSFLMWGTIEGSIQKVFQRGANALETLAPKGKQPSMTFVPSPLGESSRELPKNSGNFIKVITGTGTGLASVGATCFTVGDTEVNVQLGRLESAASLLKEKEIPPSIAHQNLLADNELLRKAITQQNVIIVGGEKIKNNLHNLFNKEVSARTGLTVAVDNHMLKATDYSFKFRESKNVISGNSANSVHEKIQLFWDWI